MAVRLRSIAVKGFRAFGAAEQTLNLPADIAAVWGPNSKGKTSLAEAFEFLLTGKIVRRELMASSQDEFADALRNAHVDGTEEVYVAARLVGVDGEEHQLKRTLTRDYAKRQECASRLEIDGTPATQSDLERLGIVLSQPPLQAPVLAQHTLGHIFSVRPQDRATYFKTLLEVTDLDTLRNETAALSAELDEPDNPLLRSFDSCAATPALRPILGLLIVKIPPLDQFTRKIEAAARALIESADAEVPEGLESRIAAIAEILEARRSKTFPVSGFRRTDLPSWTAPAGADWNKLDTYIEERDKVDQETRRLVALFDEALKLPGIAELSEPTDCPLCDTDAALMPERVQLIRRSVEDARAFTTAETAAKTSLVQLSGVAQSLSTGAKSCLPAFLSMGITQRRESGFTLARIKELLNEDADQLVDSWLTGLRGFVRAAQATRRAALATQALVDRQLEALETDLDPAILRRQFDALTNIREALVEAIDVYEQSAGQLMASLNEVIDAQADTTGWQDFLDIAAEPQPLREALIDREARTLVRYEFDEALREIDRAKEHVLEDKFSDYSGLIGKWWERLRPDEPTFFSGVQPRPRAKRTIDIKAGMSPSADRSAPKVRDVIAVFSQSQLHCLGLALFLARAEHEGLEFIILDDPVLSSDEDYRVHFNTTVLAALIGLPMQVIVLTQDHDSWEELETRYRYLGISTAQLYIETPAEGSVIENTSDALLAKISRARSLARGGHPDSRKECGIQLRDAGERFCKEMLVNDQRAKGNSDAALTDYDGKTLDWLCPRVDPLLVNDPSHPGKLEAFRRTVNDACHDNAPPGTGAMVQACGEIGVLQKEDLPR